MSPKHCVVVGGGLAGLAAAYRLTQKRLKVTLVEATERLGGRVKSHRFGLESKLVCELGGEWIGKNHKEMQQLCSEFDLPLVPHQYGNSFWNQGQPGKRFAPGVWCMSAEAKGIWQEFAKKFGTTAFQKKQAREMDKVDWWTYLEDLGFSREDLLRRDLMDSTDFGETIRMNSAYSAAAEYISTEDEEVDDTDEMDFKIKGGNERLVEALGDAIGRENIRMDWEVEKIRQDEEGVTIYGKGQDPVHADACVFAAPAHCIRKMFAFCDGFKFSHSIPTVPYSALKENAPALVAAISTVYAGTRQPRSSVSIRAARPNTSSGPVMSIICASGNATITIRRVRLCDLSASFMCRNYRARQSWQQ